MSAATFPQDLPRRRLERVLPGMLAVGVLAVLGVAAGMIFGVRGGNLVTLVLCIATAVLSLLPVLAAYAQPPDQRNVLLILFCLAYIARFVVPPMILYLPVRVPIDAPGMYMTMLSPWDVARGQLVILIALTAFLAGHWIPVFRMLGPGFPTPRRDWSPGATFSVGVVLILIGWPISTAATLGLVPAGLGSGVVSTIGSSLVFGHVLLALAYFRYHMRIALMVLAFTIPVTSLIGFLSGSKTATVLAPAFVALTYVFERRRVPLSLIAVGALALAVMYPASEFLRVYMLGSDFRFTADVLLNPGSSTSQVKDYVQSRDVGDYLSEGFSAVAARMDSTGVVSVIVRDTPRLSPFQHGKTLVLFFVSFVPRVFWPDKPNISTGQFITDVYGSGPEIQSSTAPTQIGDFYLNFGYFGVVVGMFAFGVVLRFANDLLVGRRPTATAMLAAIAVAYSVIFGFETNVALAQARVFFFLVPIAGLHYLVSLFLGSRAPERPATSDVV